MTQHDSTQPAGQDAGTPYAFAPIMPAFALLTCLAVRLLCPIPLQAAEGKQVVGVPDYEWHGGCFGTAAGNIMGFYDREGFPDFYTGPTNGGRAPLNTNGDNHAITSLWVSEAGVDGRPIDQPGHMDDYYVHLFNWTPDPFRFAFRQDRAPDCIGDFIGLSQDKWTNMNGECDGNIDGCAFVFWDAEGRKRINFQPPFQNGERVRDIPSGLRQWAQWRGYDAQVFSQLCEFEVPEGGFTFADLQREIDAGRPVLLFMQEAGENHRDFRPQGAPGRDFVNPLLHSHVAYGYLIDRGRKLVRIRDSSAGGDNQFLVWTGAATHVWSRVRGAVGFHPRPKIVAVQTRDGNVSIQWHGPKSVVESLETKARVQVDRYQVEWSPTVTDSSFRPIGRPTAELNAERPMPSASAAYFRIRPLSPDEASTASF